MSDTTHLGFIMSHSTRRSIRSGLVTDNTKHQMLGVTNLTPNQLAWKSDPKPSQRMQLAVTATFVAVPLGYTAQL